jgi:hypothetical protein
MDSLVVLICLRFEEISLLRISNTTETSHLTVTFTRQRDGGGETGTAGSDKTLYGEV